MGLNCEKTCVRATFLYGDLSLAYRWIHCHYFFFTVGTIMIKTEEQIFFNFSCPSVPCMPEKRSFVLYSSTNYTVISKWVSHLSHSNNITSSYDKCMRPSKAHHHYQAYFDKSIKSKHIHLHQTYFLHNSKCVHWCH